MVELVARGWFVARCDHAVGQQRCHSGKKVYKYVKNVSGPIFLLIMKIFFSVFNTGFCSNIPF